mgnify:CR=1 FL=1
MKPLPNSLEIIHSYVNNGQKIQKVYAMYRKKNTLRRREGLVYLSSMYAKACEKKNLKVVGLLALGVIGP